MTEDTPQVPEGAEPAVHSRIFAFQGGCLELQSYGDESEDYGGFYLQLNGYIARAGDNDKEAVMRYRPTAVGYLRTDVSRVAQLWDQTEIRRLAARLGYDFADMVIYDPQFGRPPLARLKAQANRLDAEAVFVPALKHFEDDEVPTILVQQLDVITVYPEETYSRRPLSSLPVKPPAETGGG